MPNTISVVTYFYVLQCPNSFLLQRSSGKGSRRLCGPQPSVSIRPVNCILKQTTSSRQLPCGLQRAIVSTCQISSEILHELNYERAEKNDERTTNSKKMQPHSQIWSLICRPDTPAQSSRRTMGTEVGNAAACVESVPDMYLFSLTFKIALTFNFKSEQTKLLAFFGKLPKFT